MTYVPNTDNDRAVMLSAMGLNDLSQLFDQVPDNLKLQRDLEIPGALGEMQVRSYTAELAALNANLDGYVSFMGGGIYDHYIPSTVAAITGRSEFYTAYTPYQPEISQGTLQTIFEFQTMVSRLMGMEVANASMYDAASALAEAAIMASSITDRRQWLVSECVNPAYRAVMRTYAWASGYEIIEAGRDGIQTSAESLSQMISEKTACVVVQNPNFMGSLESVAELGEAAHAHGALFVVCCDPISLGLLKPPGEYSADICVAEGQSLGIHPSYGGPLLGLFACRKQFVRQMPGRLVGATKDHDGRRGYTLTLQTREQHIRRAKASSNICTNQALCALAATVYLATVGKSGLRHIATECARRAHHTADLISRIAGYRIEPNVRFFKEFVVKCPASVADINRKLFANGIIGGLDLGAHYPDLAGHMLLCVTETRTTDQIGALVEGLRL